MSGMCAVRRPSLTREILALALAAVVFLGAVASARLQGSAVFSSPASFAALCLPGGENPDTPDPSSAPHRHCALCVTVATDCGAPQAEVPTRLALHRPFVPADREEPARNLAKAFEARGPPRQA